MTQPIKPADAERVLNQIRHRMKLLKLVAEENADDAAERIMARIAKLKEVEG